MHKLIYSSRPAAGLSRPDLRAILAASRTRNARAGVTGRLLYSDAAFLQVLEGEEEAVRATFARIEADARHHDVRVLVDEDSPGRAFGEWSMGFSSLVDREDVPDLARAGGDRSAAEALLGVEPADAGQDVH